MSSLDSRSLTRCKSTDVDSYIVTIITDRNKYLVGAIESEFCISLRWSTSRYDAARIKDPNIARQLAAIVGGKTELFNPITGKHGWEVLT